VSCNNWFGGIDVQGDMIVLWEPLNSKEAARKVEGYVYGSNLVPALETAVGGKDFGQEASAWDVSCDRTWEAGRLTLALWIPSLRFSLAALLI